MTKRVKTVTRVSPYGKRRDGARGSADERTLSRSSGEGICGSSDQLIPRPPVVSCLLLLLAIYCWTFIMGLGVFANIC